MLELSKSAVPLVPLDVMLDIVQVLLALKPPPANMMDKERLLAQIQLYWLMVKHVCQQASVLWTCLCFVSWCALRSLWSSCLPLASSSALADLTFKPVLNIV